MTIYPNICMETYIINMECVQSSSERDKSIVGAASFMANRSNDDGEPFSSCHLLRRAFAIVSRSSVCSPLLVEHYTYANNKPVGNPLTFVTGIVNFKVRLRYSQLRNSMLNRMVRH